MLATPAHLWKVLIMSKDYLLAGGWNIDNVVSGKGKISLQQAGGNALYSSMAVAIWSNKVGAVGNIPENFPQKWLNKLNNNGIDTTGVIRQKDKVEYEEWFIYNNKGDRKDQIFIKNDDLPTYIKNNKKITDQQREELINLSQKKVAQGLTFAAFREKYPNDKNQIPNDYFPVEACHLSPSSFKVHLNLAEFLNEHCKIITLDPALYVKEVPEEKLKNLLQYIDVFLPSKKELKALYPNKDIKEAVKKIAMITDLSAVVVKLGSEGSIVFDNKEDEFYHVKAIDLEVIRDLNGAGDVFCGSFLVNYNRYNNLLKAAVYGNATAAVRIEMDNPFQLLEVNPDVIEEKINHIEIERI